MKATIDISLYPLQDEYKNTIVSFVKNLRSHSGIEVDTDGMRTQIVGEYDEVLGLLQGEMKKVLQQTKAVFIIKLAKGERTKENLTSALRT